VDVAAAIGLAFTVVSLGAGVIALRDRRARRKLGDHDGMRDQLFAARELFGSITASGGQVRSFAFLDEEHRELLNHLEHHERGCRDKKLRRHLADVRQQLREAFASAPGAVDPTQRVDDVRNHMTALQASAGRAGNTAVEQALDRLATLRGKTPPA
jgi:hypothetical protein